MNLDLPDLLFLAGFIVYAGIRQRFITRTRANEKVVSHVDGTERALIGVVALGAMLLPLLYLFTPLLDWADYPRPALLPWAGVVVMVSALWLFWRSHADLDLNWSVTLEIRKDHQLIDHGVYGATRHPMYAAIWLFSLSQLLLLPNWVAGPSALVTFAPMYFVRARREEQMMCETFGDAYREYMQRTGRLFPRPGGR